MIAIDEYPQLALISWSRKVRTITDEDALALYEANRQWIERALMDDREIALLDRLIQEIGKGVWNG